MTMSHPAGRGLDDSGAFPDPEGSGRLLRTGWCAQYRAGRRWARCRICRGPLGRIGPAAAGVLWCPSCDTVPPDLPTHPEGAHP